MDVCGVITQKGTGCKVKINKHPCRFHSRSSKSSAKKEVPLELTDQSLAKSAGININKAKKTWPNIKTFWSKYKCEDVLGEGSSAEVFKISKDGKPYALKVLKHLPGTTAIEDDCIILSKLNHKGIVRCCKKVFVPHPKAKNNQTLVPALIMEYIEGCTLNVCEKPKPKVIIGWFKSLLRTLSYIHSKGVIHHDIKPANIIISKDGPVLLDFGAASLVNNKKTIIMNWKGTLRFMAPELFRSNLTRRNFDFFVKADIFGLGATFYYVLTDKLPNWASPKFKFSFETFVKTMNEFVPPSNASSIEKKLYEAVKSALAFMPVDRPTIEELLAS